MLVASLEKENIKYYIYVKKQLNRYTYYGYSEQNNVREKLSNNDVEFFKDYILNLDNLEEDTYKVNLSNDKKLINKLKKQDSLFNKLISKEFNVLPLLIFETVLIVSLCSGLIAKINKLNKELTSLENEIYSGYDTSLKDVYGGELDSKMIKDLIKASPNLNEEEKEYLINEKFYEFIDDYIDESIVYNRLKDIDIIDFTDEEKINRDKYNTGYYNYTKPNILHVRDYEEDDTLKTMSTNSHEHIHQYQGNYKYPYIVEATCSLLNKEYYTSSEMSYYEEQKRLKVLMEIIGTEPILKYIEGSFDEIDEYLIKYLKTSEREELKSLFRTSSSDKNIAEVHKKIDILLGKFYFNIYKQDIKNDVIITAIYNDLTITRNYFNINNNVDRIIEIMSTYSKLKKYFEFNRNENIVLENYSFNEIYDNPYYVIFNKLESKVLTDEEYQMLLLINPNIDSYITENYNFKYSYLEKNDGTYMIGVPSSKNKDLINVVNVTLEEAIELGYVTVERYYNPKIKSDTRKSDYSFYNKVVFKNDYFLYQHNGVDVIARIKTIPTIKDKFDKLNVKELVK